MLLSVGQSEPGVEPRNPGPSPPAFTTAQHSLLRPRTGGSLLPALTRGPDAQSNQWLLCSNSRQRKALCNIPAMSGLALNAQCLEEALLVSELIIESHLDALGVQTQTVHSSRADADSMAQGKRP